MIVKIERIVYIDILSFEHLEKFYNAGLNGLLLGRKFEENLSVKFYRF